MNQAYKVREFGLNQLTFREITLNLRSVLRIYSWYTIFMAKSLWILLFRKFTTPSEVGKNRALEPPLYLFNFPTSIDLSNFNDSFLVRVKLSNFSRSFPNSARTFQLRREISNFGPNFQLQSFRFHFGLSNLKLSKNAHGYKRFLRNSKFLSKFLESDSQGIRSKFLYHGIQRHSLNLKHYGLMDHGYTTSF